ncbi:MAG: DUF1080 domain-containing protein, partial [Rhodothermales bacterium]|nr:DUF1080 domain-containing protein [Rhodothermales bacterium]
MKHVTLFALILLPVTACAQIPRGEWAPELTEVWEPEPAVVTPGEGTLPPSDAIVLFDGSDLSSWESVRGGDARWNVADGVVTVAPGSGDIRTRQTFGSVQLHLEFRTPSAVTGEGQGRGNSGVFFHEQYEVQVLDSYENRSYSNGQLGSVYKQYPPLVNPARPPGTWQTYDIFFDSPVFDDEGKLLKPAYVTVVLNGVLIQNHVEIRGDTVYRGLPEYEAHGPGSI